MKSIILYRINLLVLLLLLSVRMGYSEEFVSDWRLQAASPLQEFDHASLSESMQSYSPVALRASGDPNDDPNDSDNPELGLVDEEASIAYDPWLLLSGLAVLYGVYRRKKDEQD